MRHSPYLPRIASGVAYDLLIHDVDFMLRLAGSMPDDVTAHFSYAHPYSQPGAEDVIEASLQFDGMLASLSASRISQRKLRSLVIYELERMIEVDLVRQDITVYRHVGADFLEDGGHGYRQQTVMDIPVVQNAREPLVSQLEHFVALASGEIDATEELDSLRAAARGGREDRRGRPRSGQARRQLPGADPEPTIPTEPSRAASLRFVERFVLLGHGFDREVLEDEPALALADPGGELGIVEQLQDRVGERRAGRSPGRARRSPTS